MAEATLNDVIIQQANDNADQKKATEENTSVLSDVAKSFNDYFKMLNQQRLDALEEKREKKKDSVFKVKSLDVAIGEKERGGILGMLGAIVLSVGGLLFGIKDAIKDYIDFFKYVFKSKFFKKVVTLPFKPFTSLVNFIRGGIYSALGLGLDGKPVINTSKRVKDLYAAGKAFTDSIGRTVTNIRNFIVGTGGAVRNFFGGIGQLFSNMRRALRVKFLRSIGPEIRKGINFVKDMFFRMGQILGIAKDGADSAKKGLSFIGVIQKFITPFFSIFRQFARFLGGPIIMGIFAIVDGVMGAFKGFTETAGSLPEKIIMGISGFISGIVSGFVGGFLDLGKMLIGFVLGLFGLDEIKEKLASFSFREVIMDMMMSIPRFVIDYIKGFVSTIKDAFTGEDGGIMKGLKVIFGSIFNVFKKIAMFPVALGAATLAALGAMLPGGKSPMEAFSDVFSKAMSFGDVNTGVGESVAESRESRQEEKKVQKTDTVEAEKKSNLLEKTRQRTVETEEEKKAVQANAMSVVNAPNTTVNNSSNTAMYGEPTPATDDLDRNYGMSPAW